MGSNEEEANVNDGATAQEGIRRQKYYVQRSIVYGLWSFLMSSIGGLVLVWWEIEYHKINTQLWMVPFGLIMLATPVIVWLSVLFSNTCNCETEPSAPPATADAAA